MQRWRRFRLTSGALCALLALWSAWAMAQTTPINGNLVVVGHQNYCDTAGSATNTYVCALGYGLTTYIDGASYLVTINADNTGAATLNLNGIGAKTIKKKIAGATVDLIAGDLKTGDKVRVVYDGTNMQLHSPVSSATNANTASTLVSRDSSGNFSAGTISAALTGNASTATALVANGANCTVAGTFPNGVDASGVSENCVALSGSLPKTATYQIVVGDFNTYKTIPVASGTFTLTLPAAANQPTDGKYIEILNYGSGVVTVARTDTTLNGGTASLVLAPGTALVPTGMRVLSDGTNYFAKPAFGNPMTTAGDFLYGGTSGAPTRFAAGTGLLTGNGASAPTFTALPLGVAVGGTGTASTLTGLVRGSASAMTATELSGDVVTSGSNVATIQAGVVTLAKMANIATASLIGRTTAGTGVPEALTVLPATLFPALTGAVTSTAGALATTPGTVVKSVYIPAGGMDVAGVCTANASAVLVTSGPKLPTITCTDIDTDGIEFELKMPNNWNASTIQVELDAFSIGNNTTEVLSLNFSGQCVRTGDSPAAHTITSGATATSGSNVAATITWGASANREQFVTTSALTLNGTCAAGSHVYLHGLVNATATTMAPMTDGKIIGARVIYTTTGADS
jgi:hypothetical protein